MTRSPHQRKSARTRQLGCLGSLSVFTLTLMVLALGTVWSLDLWRRTAQSSKPKPLTEHLQDQANGLLKQLGLSKTVVKIDSKGIFRAVDRPVRSIKEVANACVSAPSVTAPSPDAWVAVGKSTVLAKGLGYSIASLVMSKDGTTLISTGRDVKIWDLTVGKTTRNVTSQTGFVRSIALSPDESTIATGSDDGTIKIWNLTTGQRQQTLLQGGDIASLAIRADGKTLIGGSSGSIKLWDLHNGKLSSNLENGQPNPKMVLSSDNRLLAVGSQTSNTINVWDLAKAKVIARLQSDSNVTAIAINPSSRILAVAGQSSPIKLWDLGNQQPIKLLQGQQGQASAIAFSPDGRTLFAANGSDLKQPAVTVWNACTGKLVHRFGQQVRGQSIALSADGRTIATGGSGDIQVWQLP